MKFTGKIEDLKKMNFKFQKLYARNYKVYSKNDVWIWVAGGFSIEISDFFSNSDVIIDAVLNDTYPLYKEDRLLPNGQVFFKKGEPMGCVMNKKTGELIAYSDFLKKYKTSYLDFRVTDEGKDWRECHINKDTIQTIKELKSSIEK